MMSSEGFDPVADKETTRRQWQEAADFAEARREIETDLERFEGPDGFEAPCEPLVAAGTT